jgi:MFS family permease
MFRPCESDRSKADNITESHKVDSPVQNLPIDSEKGKQLAWINSILPYSIALGPVATLVQLLILNLHGTVVDVGIAVTIYNAVSIPAAIVWGFVTDRFHRRRLIIILSYLMTAGGLLSFLFARTVYSVSLLYALFSFVTSASTTPLNLLIMETESKQKWASAFARFSMIASIGQTVGLLFGMVWSSFLSLTYIVVALSILSIASAGLSVLMIKEPSIIFERQMIAMTKSSFFERLKTIPYLFFRIPRLTDFRRVFRALKYDLTRQVPVLYFSIFAFYLGSGIFNTSVVPSLQANHISSLLIFFVTTIGMLVQTVSFKYAGPYTEKKSPVKAAVWGLVLRSMSYGLLGVSVYLVSEKFFLAPFLIFYPLAAGLAYSIYYTASNTLVFDTLGDRSQGSSLGVYSALVGIATMAGSLISGFTSFYLGFYSTFIIAAICLAVSAWLIAMSVHTRPI